ncbi:MAG TPA: TIR domain-containing protein [Rhizomicrobium sp.]|nr:TIR domain-containing protein [Rhizomicrobium sp.]
MADVFISYAREDVAWVEKLNRALEAQGYSVWWDRNLATGARYLKETETQLREARATIVVWSKVSVDSHWVVDEATLARDLGRLVPISKDGTMPPLGFGQYQATDFSHWNGDAVEPLSVLLKALAERIQPTDRAVAPKRPVAGPGGRVPVAIAGGLLLLVMAAGAWWWLRPPPAVAHSMLVRLGGFQRLSEDLPATIGDTLDAEIAAAFNADGVVGVSTASVPAPGAAPAYALGGTIRRDGQTIRVITRLTNERSGATIWSDNFDYDGKELSRVPRHIAVDAGNVVRCGLFGASTYREPLPDAVLTDYMQFCQRHWDPNLIEGRKALIPAQRVVAAVPEFSWGWAAVAGAFWKVALTADNSQLVEQARASGRQAADRAVAIDGQNSEALYVKSMLVEPHDWLGRESLLKRAVAAKRLDCGCEYHQYGWMLMNVGRIADAVERLRRANDMLALYVYTPLYLADALVAAGNVEEAKSYYNAAIDLAPDSAFAKRIMVRKATRTGDAEALRDPDLPIAAELRAALQKAYRAVASGDAGAKAEAVQTLLALPQDQQGDAVARLLANLGAAHEAFQVAARLATAKEAPGPSVFWYREMRVTLSDPGFPAVAAQLGLMNYWKTTPTRPDVCNEKNAPPFCGMI